MFTGLVQDVGEVVRVTHGPMTDLWIRTALGAESFTLGESVACDGACLTVVERAGDVFRVEASPETLRRTTLGSWVSGSKVNLERALKMGDRLGGHLVLGHVDAVTHVVARGMEGGTVRVEFALPEVVAPFFIEKGSVTLDGVSLTVNTLDSGKFSVAFIPETQARTALPGKAVGTTVNLEADVIGKYVARLVGVRGGAVSSNLSEASLRAAGFGSDR